MRESKRRQPVGDRDVATLVRGAGKRRAVPPDRSERVRAAARARWRGEVQRRTRKRYLWGVAALGAAASVMLAVTWQVLFVGADLPAAPVGPALVEALTGRAWSRAFDGEAADLRVIGVGGHLRLGSELVTAEESRAAVRLASGHSVRLDGSTRIRLLTVHSLALERGAIYVDSGPERDVAGSLRVHTPLGMIEEIGTQFELRVASDAVRVRLREGKVVVHHHDRADEVRAGTELGLGRDGSVARRPIPTHGSSWEWIVGVTPMLDLEGRTARGFLEWIARERGWKLAFADESAAHAAGATVLGGRGERLTLAEALDAVLPACRMTYSVEEGVLTVAIAPRGRANPTPGSR